MNIRFVAPLLGLLLAACQSAIPFYTRPVDEPDWFKAKEAEAQAKGYPSAKDIPPNPSSIPSPAQVKAELEAVEAAGKRVNSDERAVLDLAGTRKPEAFVEQALETNTVPPLIGGQSRQKDEVRPEKAK